MSRYCERCQTEKANVHITDLQAGKKVELHLCEECAEAQGFAPKGPQASLSVIEVVQQLMQKGASGSRTREAACQKCGMTFHEFKSKGRFGCAHDYDAFEERLIGLLERIHGSSHHVGVDVEETAGPGVSGAPAGGLTVQIEISATPGAEPPTQADSAGEAEAEAAPGPEARQRLEALQKKLREAVSAERYERAAKLRDLIQELKEKLKSGREE